jgi:ferredoxin
MIPCGLCHRVCSFYSLFMNEKIDEGPIEKEATDEEIKEARNEIMSIRQEIHAMGANDYEMPAISFGSELSKISFARRSEENAVTIAV